MSHNSGKAKLGVSYPMRFIHMKEFYPTYPVPTCEKEISYVIVMLVAPSCFVAYQSSQ